MGTLAQPKWRWYVNIAYVNYNQEKKNNQLVFTSVVLNHYSYLKLGTVFFQTIMLR